MTEPAPLYRVTGAGKTPRTCGTCRYCEPSRLDYTCAWPAASELDPYPDWLTDEVCHVDPSAPTDCPAWTPRR